MMIGDHLHELNLIIGCSLYQSFLTTHERNRNGVELLWFPVQQVNTPNAALIDYGATKAAMISISKSSSKEVWCR